MEISKVGVVPNYGRKSSGYKCDDCVEPQKHKEISAKNLSIAAVAITSIGLAAIALVKKGKVKYHPGVLVVQDKAVNKLHTVDVKKLRALPKEIKNKVSTLLSNAITSDDYSKILKEYNIC